MRIKTLVFAVLSFVFSGTMTLWGENNPQANPEAVVTSGKARFTVLTPEMIRIEYSDKGFFEDRATFTVVNRNLAVPHYSKSEDATFIYIETDKLKLKYRKGTNPRTLPPSSSNLSITLNHNGREVLWYPGKPDPLNLKGTCRTLDGSNGQNKRSEMEDGLISRSGWAVIEDSWTSSRSDGSRSFAFEPEPELGYDWWAERKDPHALDIYFLGYGSNYKKALSDYTQIAGKIPLPPSYVFGYWYSKYSSYSADDYREIMNDLSSNNIPTDVMILDMDWHWNGSEGSMSGGRGGWTGWSWNTNLIPDPKGLLKEMHDICIDLINLIDESLLPASNEPEQRVYFEKMKGDYYRYICENKEGDIEGIIEKASQCYQAGLDIARSELTSTNPTFLGLVLNYSVFLYEIMDHKNEAIDLSQITFSDTVDLIDNTDDATYNETTMILHLLQTNHKNWINERDNE